MIVQKDSFYNMQTSNRNQFQLMTKFSQKYQQTLLFLISLQKVNQKLLKEGIYYREILLIISQKADTEGK